MTPDRRDQLREVRVMISAPGHLSLTEIAEMFWDKLGRPDSVLAVDTISVSTVQAGTVTNRRNEMTTTAGILARAGVTREELGRRVRQEWVAWARQQPHPKPAWLLPYDELSPADQEADCQIGEELFCLGFEAAQP